MAETQKVALVTGAGTGIGKAAALALVREGYAVVLAGRRKETLEETRRGREPTARASSVPTDVSDPDIDQGAVRPDQGDLRPARSCCSTTPASARRRADRRAAAREVEGGGRHQPHRHVPLHAGGVPDHEGAEPARRPHHQQRLDLRAHAAAALRRLHGDQARGHRADQIDRARRPRLRHRLRPDRHRQRRDPDDRRMVQGQGVLQPDGRRWSSRAWTSTHVGRAVVYMASLPLDANVLFMTVMANEHAVRRPRRPGLSSSPRREPYPAYRTSVTDLHRPPERDVERGIGNLRRDRRGGRTGSERPRTNGRAASGASRDGAGCSA